MNGFLIANTLVFINSNKKVELFLAVNIRLYLNECGFRRIVALFPQDTNWSGNLRRVRPQFKKKKSPFVPLLCLLASVFLALVIQ